MSGESLHVIARVGIRPDTCDFCDEPTKSTVHLPAADIHLCWDHDHAFTKSNAARRGRWIEKLRRLHAEYQQGE